MEVPAEGVGQPEAGVAGSCENPDMGAGGQT